MNAVTHDTKHLLVVEDDEDSREMLCELLTLLGYKVSSASSGEDAINTLKQGPERFDVLLSDISLPGMSGVELARQARAHHPELNIIFASGYAGISGADFPFYSLLKPYDLTQLQQVLEQAVEAAAGH